MNVLIIGKGGREHALAWKISQSEELDNLYIAPGNGGTRNVGVNVDLDPLDFQEIREFCKDNLIDFLVVGPEEPLSYGIADALEGSHTYVIGPRRRPAQLEASKRYGKIFMENNNIPTPNYKIFADKDELVKFLKGANYPLVLKTNGLASGKGSNIAYSYEEALDILNIYYTNPYISEAADRIIVEEYISGEELSIFLVISETQELLLGIVKDYKHLLSGGGGPSTGGMGAIMPVPFMNKKLQSKLYEEVIQPTIKGLRKDFPEYRGFLYIGAIYSDNKFYVLEYNVRLGDPETQCMFPRIDIDLLDLFVALKEDRLKNKLVIPSREVSLTLTLAHKDYPYRNPVEPFEVRIPKLLPGVVVFHGNTYRVGYKYMSSGGRVVYVTALSDSYENAHNIAVSAADSIEFDGKYYRDDIGIK